MIDIFDLLLAKGQVSPSTIRAIKTYCDTWSCCGFDALLETHIYEEDILADRLAEYFKIDRVYSIFADETGASIREMIPYKMAREWNCFPSLINHESNRPEIIIADPTQRRRVAFFRDKFQNHVDFAVASRGDIRRAIDEHYVVSDFLPFLA